MSKKRPAIKITNREFDSIQQALREFAKKEYIDVAKDKSKASPDMMLLDEVAYIGDQLSLALDYYANESFIDTASEPRNIIRQGKFRGYKFVNNPSSFGIVDFYISVPVDAGGVAPDENYMPTLKRGSEFASVDGVGFILNEDVDFGNSNNEIRVATVDDTDGSPLTYAIKASGQVISGEIKEEYVTVGSFERFKKIRLTDPNITEVLLVEDAEGKEYHVVDNISEEVVFKAIPNRDSTSRNAGVASIMKPFPVPRRCVAEQENGVTYLQFGFGSDSTLDETLPTDPSNIILELHGKDYISDKSFDPSKLISSDTFGIAPANTTLRVLYRANTRGNVNVSVGGLTRVVRPVLDFKDEHLLSAIKRQDVISSMLVDNVDPIVGDITFPTREELKIRIKDSFASQNRAVTKRDYISVAYSMPSYFGSVKRASIVQDRDSFRRNLNMYVVSENRDGTLTQTNSVLKNNLKNWLLKYKMANDSIDIIDAIIVNIGINFVIVGELGVTKTAILSRAVSKLSEQFRTKMEIGEPLSVSNLYSVLNRTEGVVDVVDVEIVKKAGGIYASNRFDIDDFISADGRVLYVPEDVILELKYPNLDILGVVR